MTPFGEICHPLQLCIVNFFIDRTQIDPKLLTFGKTRMMAPRVVYRVPVYFRQIAPRSKYHIKSTKYLSGNPAVKKVLNIHQ